MSRPQLTLCLDASPGQDRLAFLDAAGVVIDIWFNPHHRPNLVGSVHQVCVTRLFVSQSRATARLVDGTEISIRLRRPDLNRIKQGALVLVTIVAAPRHGKTWQAVIGARLVGRDMVLLFGLSEGSPQLKLSSEIPVDQREAALMRLSKMAGTILGPGFGVILRRDAATLPDFRQSITALLDSWQAGFHDCGTSVGLVHDGGGLLGRALRLYPDAALVEDAKTRAEIGVMLDDAISSMMSRKVRLACGGSLWCERTHALWAVDVDGGSCDDLYRLGVEAVDEIARQIRLRGMTGDVLIDLPRLSSDQTRALLNQFAFRLSDDPRRPVILGRTRGGIIELRVPHGDMAVDEIMTDQPAQDALAGLRLVAAHPPFQPVRLAVSRAMADWLNSVGKTAIESLDRQLELIVWSEDSLHKAAYICNSDTQRHGN
jgi:Ribonuclease G/E